MKNIFTLLLFTLSYFGLQAQLSDGSLAPAWELTDLNGNDHELYDYLDDGKDVIIDFSATWCPPCWSYHNSGVLDDLYHNMGPSGTDEIMVFFIEGDSDSNDACLYGDVNNCSDVTLGNWTNGVDYPIFNPTGGDLSVVNSYNISFWPTLYAINAEHQTVWLVGQASYNSWANLITESFTLEADYSVSPGPCDVGEIEIDALGGWGSITYSWSSGDTGSTVEVESGLYDVTVEDGNGYFIVIEDIEIQNDEAQFLVDDEEILMPSCNGADDGSIYVDIDSNDDIDYEWSNGADDQFNNDLESGDYTLTIYNNSNGCSLVLEYEVDEPNEIELTADVIHSSCGMDNGIIDAYATGGTGLLYYDFGNGYSTEDVLTDVSPGTYLVYVEDENECLTTIEVVVEASEELQGTIVGELELDCAASQTIVTVEPNTPNPIEYQWVNELGEVIVTESFVTITLPGNYAVNMVDSEGCSTSIPFTVSENTDAPELVLAGISALDCQTPTINVSVENETMAYDVVWSYIDVNGDEQEVLSNSLEIIAAGDYSVMLTNIANGCQSFESFTIEMIENEPISSFDYGVEIDIVDVSSTSMGVNLTEVWTVDGVQVELAEDGTIVFEENGTYVICLEITNECGVSSHCETVEISGIVSSVGDLDLEGLNMYFNGEQLIIDNQIQSMDNSRVMIYDLEGRLVQNTNQTLIVGRQFVDVTNVNTGIYLVHLETELGDEVMKVFITQ